MSTNRKYTPTIDKKSYYDNLIENHNHPIKPSKQIGRYKTVMKCLQCEKIGTEYKYQSALKLFCSKLCKDNYHVKFIMDNNIRTKSKRSSGTVENDFPRVIRRKIFEHDLLKPNKALIKLAIEKFILDINLADYLCKKCLRPVELKKNLRDNIKYSRSLCYNVELSHIEHDPYKNEIEFDDDFNIISKSVEFICDNCHSLENTQPLRTEVK